MSYIPNTDEDRASILSSIGVDSIEELFSDIPSAVKETSLPKLDEGMDEIGLMRHMKALAGQNTIVSDKISFLGGGVYNHFIPSVVKHITSRSEFYTAYTPYQPEISQGILQAIYEYQTMICDLTGMVSANASHYDGATALAEAALLSCNYTGRKKIVVSNAVNPNYRKVIETYLNGAEIEIVYCGFSEGTTDINKLKTLIDDKTASVVVQNPNFFGCIEEVFEIGEAAHSKGALFILSIDMISLGMLKKPSEYGADIVTAEGQPLGNKMSFGGPLLGIFAVKKELTRYMPGRIVGLTSDKNGKRGFVLTLQTREQHIRREKATSNICSNQTLCALAAAVYLSAIGKNGLSNAANICLNRASYAKEKISGLKGISLWSKAPTFKEFVIKLPKDAGSVNKHLLSKNIIGGIDLEKFYPEMKNCMLLCFTEMNSKEDIDCLITALKDV